MTPRAGLGEALGLALAAAASLGLARFSYALMLPPMRADLAWSYATAGLMNAVNAAGYLAGAWLMPALLRRHDARRILLAGSLLAAAGLALHGAVRSETSLALLRALTGAASALSFVGGGLLAARLASAAPGRSGLVLGVYYGGVGFGIVVSSLVVPPLVVDSAGWPGAWAALGLAALACTAVTAATTTRLAEPPAAGAVRVPVRWAPLGFALAGYLMFGLGYIGYMTFVVTLLREQGLSPGRVVAFYVLLGCGVMVSSWLWSGLLQRHRSALPLAVLNALLSLATVLPAVGGRTAAVFGSGLLFGCVFLSVVASTTAFVRHNLEPASWPAGIAAFTVVFAFGQIVGPAVVGLIADAGGGLQRGLGVSAAMLAAGAVLAALQRPLCR